jgi:hypothetical protein
LIGITVPTEELAGGGGVRATSLDRAARRVLVTGRAVPPVAGRADDFSWPREGADNRSLIPATSGRIPQRPPGSGFSSQ